MSEFSDNVIIGGYNFKPIDTYPKYAYILKDWQRTSDHHPRTGGLYWQTTVPSIDYANMKDYTAHRGMPDQFNRYDDEFIELGGRQQWLWMNVCCQTTWGKDYAELDRQTQIIAKENWKNLTWNHLCFNNATGREDGYDDYVLPFNGWRDTGMKQESIVCSTPDKYNEYDDMNLVKIIGEAVPFRANYLGKPAERIMHYPIEVIDVKKPLPSAKELVNKKWLCHRPSVSTGKYLGGGKYQIDPFPQFQSPITGMPESRYILWGNGTSTGYIRTDWVKLI